MSRRGWLVLAVIAAVAASAVTALAQSTPRANVSPRLGTKKSSFGVRFRAPRTVGSGSTASEYTISASGPSARGGCDATASSSVTSAQQGQMVHVTLKPSAGKKWCVGKFQGQVSEIIRPTCGCPQPTQGTAKSLIVCPMICAQRQFIGVVPVAKFSFRVEKHPPHKSRTR
jgi:ribosomal protein L21E